MTRVIDASVACKWFFEEPLSADARELALVHPALVAPDLIIAECANVAWRRVRDGQVSVEQAEASLKALPDWFQTLTPSADLHQSAFRIARTLGHPVYDCLYIALAARDAAPLITADKALLRRVRGSVWQDLVQFLGDALDA